MKRPSRGAGAGALLTMVALGLVVALAPAPTAGAGDKPADPARAGDKPADKAVAPEQPAPALPLDKAFVRHVNFNRLGAAVRHMDSPALTDAALNMADCERVLHRPYAALPADKLMGMAAQLAAQKRDKASLERLAAAAEKSGNTALVGQIRTAQKLADAPRAVEPDKVVVVTDVNPARFALTREYLHYMDLAKLTGDAALLDRMDKFLSADERLNPDERSKLQKDVASAKSVLPEKPDTVRLALAELAAASRDGDDGDSGDGGTDNGGPDNGGPDMGPDNGGPDPGGPDNGGPDLGPDNGSPDNGGPDNGGPDNGGPDNGGPDNGGPDNGNPAPPYYPNNTVITNTSTNTFINNTVVNNTTQNNLNVTINTSHNTTNNVNNWHPNLVVPVQHNPPPVVHPHPAIQPFKPPPVIHNNPQPVVQPNHLKHHSRDADPNADPAFARYVRLSDISDAWSALDPAALTDAGLEMAEGERVLGRTHRSGITADSVLHKAVALATDKRDKETLDRLAATAEERGDAGLKGQVQNARKLSSADRAVDPALQLDIDQTTSSDFARYQELVEAVRSAQLLGDAEALKAIEKRLDQPPALPASQKDEIHKLIVRAREGLPDKLAPAEDALCKLVGPSRDYAPTEVQGTWKSAAGPTIVLAGADADQNGWQSGKATDSAGQTTRYRWMPQGQGEGVLYIGGGGVATVGPVRVTLSADGRTMRWQVRGAPITTLARAE